MYKLYDISFHLLTRSMTSPADIRLANTPETIFSTPDGSALVVVEKSGESGFYLRSFYISTFGSSVEGSLLGETTVFHGCTSFLLTCFENRGTPHLLALSPSKHSIESRLLRISKQTSEFQFQSKNRHQGKIEQAIGEQNALIDCFSEVWTRYPVIPAISRCVHHLLSVWANLSHDILIETQSLLKPGYPDQSYLLAPLMHLSSSHTLGAWHENLKQLHIK